MEFKHPKYYAELRKIARAQAAKLTSTREGGPESRQAQPEVVLKKKIIDKGSKIGYSGIDDVTAIHGGHSSARSVQPKATSNTGDAPHMGPRNSAAETLHLEQHKYPGDGSSRMVQGYGPQSSSQLTNPQDEEHKPSSPEPRGQASSPRNPVPGSGSQGTSESPQASGHKQQG
mgnify:CR=1 FL=1